MDQSNQNDNIETSAETSLKKTLINLDRKHDENQKLRIKYHDDPNKFANSETELYATLNELQNFGTQPELYRILTTKKSISTLLDLICHENTDISAKVIHILQEFTDTEDNNDTESEPVEKRQLIDTFLGENLIELLVTNISRLNEANEEESLAINRSLDIIDNLIDYRSTLACDKSIESLLTWMINQLKTKQEYNSIKNAIIELSSTLLASSNEIKLKLVELGGLDALLQQVAHYRRCAPETGDEHEYLEQLIDCLCMATLNCDENRNMFFEEEGVDLILVILREKREAVKKSNIKLGVLKLFSNVLTTDKNHDSAVTQCCERFIEALGLGVIFPLFMNPKIVLSARTKRSEYHDMLQETEEHTSAIILALLKHCKTSEYIQRILVKFAEANFAKFLRVVDIHDKYFSLIQNQNDDEAEELEEMVRRASFILETVDYMILLICFLSQQFETYDPTSGETFVNYFGKLLSRRPELKHQIILEAERHIEELAQDSATRNSLEFLLGDFEKLSKKDLKQHNQD